MHNVKNWKGKKRKLIIISFNESHNLWRLRVAIFADYGKSFIKNIQLKDNSLELNFTKPKSIKTTYSMTFGITEFD